jgi:hypothetical protein
LNILLAAALLLPSIFWDKGPETAHLLKEAQITQISVPASMINSWKTVSGISVSSADLTQAKKIPPPAIKYQRHRATATAAPWVDSNGWRFIRDPAAIYFYEATGKTAAMSAAEAFAYGVHAYIHTDEAGLQPLGQLLAFLRKMNPPKLPVRANIGFIDDGTPASGEFMNLLVRRNLLLRLVKAPDPSLDLTVKLGTPDYPSSEAGNPSMLAERVRANLTDAKRLLRIYGSEVVVGRLYGNQDKSELYLLNYGASRVPVDGLRVRVLGDFHHASLHDSVSPNEPLLDVLHTPQATEFTLKDLSILAIVDLTH